MNNPLATITAPTPTPAPDFFENVGNSINGATIFLCISVVVVVLIGIWLISKAR